jgi:DNA polymerase-3 subunit alpha
MIVCVDTETTGLVKQGKPFPAIVQIGIALYPEGPEHSWLIDPEIPDAEWQEDAMQITGLSPQVVRGKPSFFTAGSQFAQGLVGARVWMGWNISHDIEILSHTLKRYGMEHNFPWPPVHLDLMHVAYETCNIQGRNGRKFPKLEEAYEILFGSKFEGAHDALADVRATIAIAEKIAPEQLEWLL